MDLYRNENLGGRRKFLGFYFLYTEGDTSISYRSSAIEFKDTLIKDYKSQLNKYRKVGLVICLKV